MNSSGIVNTGKSHTVGRKDGGTTDLKSGSYSIKFSYGNSNNEIRVKSKFFSLMIYAGYPMQ